MRSKRLGWIPDLPDHRDHVYSAPRRALPKKVDLRKLCPPAYDQLELGSCTANAIGGAIQFEQRKQELPEFMPSRLFVYYNERAMEGTIRSDSGAMIRDGIKSVAKQGVCPESEWPYDIATFIRKPPPSCYASALQHKAIEYQRLESSQLRACLASGYPAVFGFTVYESFESPKVERTGIVPMPGEGESVIGGHAVLAVGYDANRYLVRNSYGTGWGINGYFWIPKAYVEDPNLADDFWTIRSVS